MSSLKIFGWLVLYFFIYSIIASVIIKIFPDKDISLILGIGFVLTFILFAKRVMKRKVNSTAEFTSTKSSQEAQSNDVLTTDQSTINDPAGFIAIDFETANNNRISACALGIALVQNGSFTHEKFFYIKPPDSENFLSQLTKIHGIRGRDVENASTFDYIWKNELKHIFNNNLVIYHNGSMDLSVLKNLFKFYDIHDYRINHLDTMLMAKDEGLPTKLVDLSIHYEIDIEQHHNPLYDAKACANIFYNFQDDIPHYENYIQTLTPETNNIQVVKTGYNISKSTKENKALANDNLAIITKYSITEVELSNVEIKSKGFVFTGDIEMYRSDAKKIITDNGGLIKPGVSSKVDYVVLGTGFGWSKVQKIEHFNTNKNCNIKILNSNDFEKLISTIIV